MTTTSDTEIKQLIGKLDQKLDQLYEKFNQKLDKLEEKLSLKIDKLDEKVDEIKLVQGRNEEKLNGIDKRFVWTVSKNGIFSR
jgi:Skp family chaperone for outer membrane proteins